MSCRSCPTFVREGIVPRLGRLLNQTKLVQIFGAGCAAEREIVIGHIFDWLGTTDAHKKFGNS
jgi:hypothetical protein